jgi:hypothetical protein
MIANLTIIIKRYLVLHGRQWSWHSLLYGGKKSGAVIQQSAGLTLIPKYIEF